MPSFHGKDNSFSSRSQATGYILTMKGKISIWTVMVIVTMLYGMPVRAATVDEVCSVLPVNTLILEPESCTKWIKCSSTAGSTNHEKGACVTGTYFDLASTSCKSREQVRCPYDQEVAAESCSNQKNDIYLPDANDCNAFIYCRDGKSLKSNCPYGMVFEPQSQSCVYKDQYNCKATGQTNEFESPICRSLKNRQQIADETDCTKYHMCVNGELKSETCPAGNAYDYTTGLCVSIDRVVCYPKSKKPEPLSTICMNKQPNSYVPDEKSCVAYYFCAKQTDGSFDRQPKNFKCEEGLFFDEIYLSCRDRTQVKCQLDRCEGMHEKYVNVIGDCKSYAYCKNGVTASSGKCQSPYYFDERVQSCTSDTINYPACQPFTL